VTTTAREAHLSPKIREQRRAQRKRRSARLMQRAREQHAALAALLGGHCVYCGDTGINAPLSIDHVDGITWSHKQYNLWDRVKRYWQEYRTGVRLRVLCVPCNRRRGRPTEEEAAAVPLPVPF
jgi:5-methylcytosine-specific restriction endonuclease McrA